MYDAVAEIFVCGVAIAYLGLVIILALYWVRSIARGGKTGRTKPPAARSQQSGV